MTPRIRALADRSPSARHHGRRRRSTRSTSPINSLASAGYGLTVVDRFVQTVFPEALEDLARTGDGAAEAGKVVDGVGTERRVDVQPHVQRRACRPGGHGQNREPGAGDGDADPHGTIVHIQHPAEQFPGIGVSGTMRRLVSGAVLLGLLSAVLFAQPPADPSFEVASVKSNRTEAPATTLFPLGPGDAYAANGGRFRATNQPLITYLRFAYRLGQADLLDLPKWVYNERFDIEARANGEPSKDQMRLMMRSLLKDRFKLVVHTEQRVQAVYDLELAKPGQTGPQLRAHQTDDTCVAPIAPEFTTLSPSQPSRRSPSMFQLPTLPCGSRGFVTIGNPGDRVRIVGNGEPMDRIAQALRSPATGIERHIRDRTGLSGTFDLSLEWSVVSDTVQAPVTSKDDMPTRFLEALKTQWGLILRSTKGPVDILVGDKVERPTEK